MDIKSMTETELKALAFDEMVKLQQTQHNLAIINQELQSRVKQAITSEQTAEG